MENVAKGVKVNIAIIGQKIFLLIKVFKTRKRLIFIGFFIPKQQ